MEEITNKQQKKSRVPIQLQPYQWKKGQSGNIAGRPKGKTLKEYVREYLACMTEEEREDFLNGLSKETIWKMAEGNPQDSGDITSGGKPIPILNINALLKNDSDTTNTEPNQED